MSKKGDDDDCKPAAPMFSAADLQSATKGLAHSEAKESSRKPDDAEQAMLDYAEKLYNDNSGDLEAIFKELDEDPDKVRGPVVCVCVRTRGKIYDAASASAFASSRRSVSSNWVSARL